MPDNKINTKAVLAGFLVALLGGFLVALPIAIALVSALGSDTLAITDITSLTAGGLVRLCWQAAPLMCILAIVLAVIISVVQGYVTAVFAPGAEMKNAWGLALLLLVLSLGSSFLDGGDSVLGMTSQEVTILMGASFFLTVCTVLGGKFRTWQVGATKKNPNS